MLPVPAWEFGTYLFSILAVVAILYGAACAIAQDDLKRMLAYSSFSHLGFCLLGIFALNETGLTGSYLQMINHGLNVGALFFICEILHHRYGTTKFKDLQGLGCKLKILSGITVFMSCAVLVYLVLMVLLAKLCVYLVCLKLRIPVFLVKL